MDGVLSLSTFLEMAVNHPSDTEAMATALMTTLPSVCSEMTKRVMYVHHITVWKTKPES